MKRKTVESTDIAINMIREGQKFSRVMFSGEDCVTNNLVKLSMQRFKVLCKGLNVDYRELIRRNI